MRVGYLGGMNKLMSPQRLYNQKVGRFETKDQNFLRPLYSPHPPFLSKSRDHTHLHEHDSILGSLGTLSIYLPTYLPGYLSDLDNHLSHWSFKALEYIITIERGERGNDNPDIIDHPVLTIYVVRSHGYLREG